MLLQLSHTARSLFGQFNRKCSTVSAAALHWVHFVESVTFIFARYSFKRHFPNRSLVIVVSLTLFRCAYLIFLEMTGSIFL